MTYIETTLNLTQSQKQKIASAVRQKKGVTIRLSVSNLSGSDKIHLTKQQINKIRKARSKGTGVDIKLSKTQLSKQGGFLGALLGGLAASVLPQLLGGIFGKGIVLPGTKPSTTPSVTGRGKKKNSKGISTTGDYLKKTPTIYRNMGKILKPLSNIDIDSIMKKHKVSNYRGTYSKDMLPKRINDSESMIVNLKDYFKGGRTHWIAIYNDKNSNTIEYFDSFGLKPAVECIDYMKTSTKPIEYNSSQIQDINSIMCGFYCCNYIIKRYRGIEPIDILLDFNQKPTLCNELFIRDFASKII